MYANTAGVSSKATETKIENIVLADVLLMQDERRTYAMNPKKTDAVLLYKLTMAGVKHMLKQGIITPEEFCEIEQKTAQDFGLSLSVIYRLKPLI